MEKRVVIDHFLDESPAHETEIHPLSASGLLRIAKRPILVTMDMDGWLVMAPAIQGSPDAQGDYLVKYLPAPECFPGEVRATSKDEAMDQALALSRKLGDGIAIDLEQSLKMQTKRKELHGDPEATPVKGENFSTFAKRLWGSSWVLARKTKRMLAKYGRVLTHKEYDEAYNLWQAAQVAK